MPNISQKIIFLLFCPLKRALKSGILKPCRHLLERLVAHVLVDRNRDARSLDAAEGLCVDLDRFGPVETDVRQLAGTRKCVCFKLCDGARQGNLGHIRALRKCL